jgi:hypothetical protein
LFSLQRRVVGQRCRKCGGFLPSSVSRLHDNWVLAPVYAKLGVGVLHSRMLCLLLTTNQQSHFRVFPGAYAQIHTRCIDAQSCTSYSVQTGTNPVILKVMLPQHQLTISCSKSLILHFIRWILASKSVCRHPVAHHIPFQISRTRTNHVVENAGFPSY